MIPIHEWTLRADQGHVPRLVGGYPVSRCLSFFCVVCFFVGECGTKQLGTCWEKFCDMEGGVKDFPSCVPYVALCFAFVLSVCVIILAASGN